MDNYLNQVEINVLMDLIEKYNNDLKSGLHVDSDKILLIKQKLEKRGIEINLEGDING